MIDTVRKICRALPETTEDIKWSNDLVFSVGGRMFAVVCLEPPHTVAFKTTPDLFADLVERDGIIPAPYLARAMWVQDQGTGNTLDRRELEQLLRGSYELVKAKLPKKRAALPTRRPKKPVKTSIAKRSKKTAATPARKKSG